MRFLLAGGGTGGHVNPLIALATELRNQGHQVYALGTKEGLEQRLVPERGFELLTVKKLPLPRKLSLAALSFPVLLARETIRVLGFIRRYKIDGVVGFGGYASPPAYLAGFLARKPLLVHEANAIAGYANRLGAKLGAKVAIAFPNSNLPGTLTGMPLRTEIVKSAAEYDKGQARVELGLDPMLPTLLVTGGSLGAKRINETIMESLELLRAAGIQVLHIVGAAAGLEDVSEPGYRRMSYCSRMDAAIAASNLAVSRAGASTVSEFSAAGLPAIYVPYPVGNGEQQQNAATVVAAGGAELVLDKDFNPEFVANRVIPILSHAATLKRMAQASQSVAIVDGTLLLRDLLLNSVNTKSRD
jgi:UDP-N-acetylglucosamine--N-acetylmuramyl-(pentapeptide) pyrophosphoryl-undecaprenol N-acetylglucosamine transferase